MKGIEKKKDKIRGGKKEERKRQSSLSTQPSFRCIALWKCDLTALENYVDVMRYPGSLLTRFARFSAYLEFIKYNYLFSNQLDQREGGNGGVERLS